MEKKKIYFNRLIGFLVIVISIFLFAKARRHYVKVDNRNYYKVYAYFNRIDGLKNDSDVRISGIKVGNVTKISLTPNNRVKVEMRVKKSYELPEDSSILIQTSGMIGPKFVDIRIGMGDEMIADGGTFYGQTQDSLMFLDILGAGAEMFVKKNAEHTTGETAYTDINMDKN